MKNILYILVLAIFATSCSDDWMDIEPKGKVIPSKVGDYRLLLDNTSSWYQGGITTTADLDIYMSDDIVLRDDLIGAYYSEWIPKAFQFEDHLYLESEEDESMNPMYASIYTANTVINEVLLTVGDEDEKKKLYAEAKIHRAFSYLKLVNLYALPYNSITASNDLGVPLQLEPIIEGDLTRSTIQEVYDLILDDINEVFDYLPETGDELWRPSKASASALLARTYLIMGDFTNALKYADMALGFYDYLTDYNFLWPHWWVSDILDFGRLIDNQEQYLMKAAVSQYRLVYPSQDWMDLFDQENDLRFVGKVGTDYVMPMEIPMFYYNSYCGGPYGLTVPEMLLTRAECYARAGNAADAMDDVNTLRQKRIAMAAYVPLTATDANEALSIVKAERRRELSFQGIRFMDIRRYNVYDNANISIVHTVNGETFTLAPGDNKWALPFARKYINKNPEIEQNPR